jgi:hypothetical protein
MNPSPATETLEVTTRIEVTLPCAVTPPAGAAVKIVVGAVEKPDPLAVIVVVATPAPANGLVGVGATLAKFGPMLVSRNELAVLEPIKP